MTITSDNFAPAPLYTSLIGDIKQRIQQSQTRAMLALVALVYSDRDAGLALKALPADVGVSEGIKLALKALAK